MTNRDKLLNMSLYDLIMSVNCHRGCKLAVITDELLTQICYEHKGKCSECIADWLNREAKHINKI